MAASQPGEPIDLVVVTAPFALREFLADSSGSKAFIDDAGGAQTTPWPQWQYFALCEDMGQPKDGEYMALLELRSGLTNDESAAVARRLRARAQTLLPSIVVTVNRYQPVLQHGSLRDGPGHILFSAQIELSATHEAEVDK